MAHLLIDQNLKHLMIPARFKKRGSDEEEDRKEDVEFVHRRKKRKKNKVFLASVFNAVMEKNFSRSTHYKCKESEVNEVELHQDRYCWVGSCTCRKIVFISPYDFKKYVSLSGLKTQNLKKVRECNFSLNGETCSKEWSISDTSIDKGLHLAYHYIKTGEVLGTFAFLAVQPVQTSVIRPTRLRPSIKVDVNDIEIPKFSIYESWEMKDMGISKTLIIPNDVLHTVDNMTMGDMRLKRIVFDKDAELNKPKFTQWNRDVQEYFIKHESFITPDRYMDSVGPVIQNMYPTFPPIREYNSVKDEYTRGVMKLCCDHDDDVKKYGGCLDDQHRLRYTLKDHHASVFQPFENFFKKFFFNIEKLNRFNFVYKSCVFVSNIHNTEGFKKLYEKNKDDSGLTCMIFTEIDRVDKKRFAQKSVKLRNLEFGISIPINYELKFIKKNETPFIDWISEDCCFARWKCEEEAIKDFMKYRKEGVFVQNILDSTNKSFVKIFPFREFCADRDQKNFSLQKTKSPYICHRDKKKFENLLKFDDDVEKITCKDYEDERSEAEKAFQTGGIKKVKNKLFKHVEDWIYPKKGVKLQTLRPKCCFFQIPNVLDNFYDDHYHTGFLRVYRRIVHTETEDVDPDGWGLFKSRYEQCYEFIKNELGIKKLKKLPSDLEKLSDAKAYNEIITSVSLGNFIFETTHIEDGKKSIIRHLHNYLSLSLAHSVDKFIERLCILSFDTMMEKIKKHHDGKLDFLERILSVHSEDDLVHKLKEYVLRVRNTWVIEKSFQPVKKLYSVSGRQIEPLFVFKKLEIIRDCKSIENKRKNNNTENRFRFENLYFTCEFKEMYFDYENEKELLLRKATEKINFQVEGEINVMKAVEFYEVKDVDFFKIYPEKDLKITYKSSHFGFVPKLARILRVMLTKYCKSEEIEKGSYNILMLCRKIETEPFVFKKDGYSNFKIYEESSKVLLSLEDIYNEALIYPDGTYNPYFLY